MNLFLEKSINDHRRQDADGESGKEGTPVGLIALSHGDARNAHGQRLKSFGMKQSESQWIFIPEADEDKDSTGVA